MLQYKEKLELLIDKTSLSEDVQHSLTQKFKTLKERIHECIKILKGKPLEEKSPADLSTPEEKDRVSSSEEEEKEEASEEENFSSLESLDSKSEDEIPKMAPKLDIGLALKLVKPFDGNVTVLTSYIESVELLFDYVEDVPGVDILKFLRTTLEGAAHGTIDGADSTEMTFNALRQKFAIKITPKAVENEMNYKRRTKDPFQSTDLKLKN